MPGKKGTERARERLLAELSRRRMLEDAAAGDELGAAGTPLVPVPLTIWGQPAWRGVPAAGSPGAPQALEDAAPRQKRLVEIAHATPPCGDDACAAWVEEAWSRMGLGLVAGHARDLYERYCGCCDLGLLCVGMVVAVPESPYTAAGLKHGHAGLYVGDEAVMDCAADRVRRVPLDLWLSTYGVMAEPRWGWLAHVPLG